MAFSFLSSVFLSLVSPTPPLEGMPGYLGAIVGCQAPECTEVAAFLELVRADVFHPELGSPTEPTEEWAGTLSHTVLYPDKWWYDSWQSGTFRLSQEEYLLVEQAFRQGDFVTVYKQTFTDFLCPTCRKICCHEHLDFRYNSDDSSEYGLYYDVFCPNNHYLRTVID